MTSLVEQSPDSPQTPSRSVSRRRLAVDDEVVVNVPDHNIKEQKGVVKYIGEPTFSKGEWIGVQLRGPNGKNDGSVAGVKYFECLPKHGVFVRRAAVGKVKKKSPSKEGDRSQSVSPSARRSRSEPRPRRGSMTPQDKVLKLHMDELKEHMEKTLHSIVESVSPIALNSPSGKWPLSPTALELSAPLGKNDFGMAQSESTATAAQSYLQHTEGQKELTQQVILIRQTLSKFTDIIKAVEERANCLQKIVEANKKVVTSDPALSSIKDWMSQCVESIERQVWLSLEARVEERVRSAISKAKAMFSAEPEEMPKERQLDIPSTPQLSPPAFISSTADSVESEVQTDLTGDVASAALVSASQDDSIRSRHICSLRRRLGSSLGKALRDGRLGHSCQRHLGSNDINELRTRLAGRFFEAAQGGVLEGALQQMQLRQRLRGQLEVAADNGQLEGAVRRRCLSLRGGAEYSESEVVLRSRLARDLKNAAQDRRLQQAVMPRMESSGDGHVLDLRQQLGQALGEAARNGSVQQLLQRERMKSELVAASQDGRLEQRCIQAAQSQNLNRDRMCALGSRLFEKLKSRVEDGGLEARCIEAAANQQSNERIHSLRWKLSQQLTKANNDGRLKSAMEIVDGRQKVAVAFVQSASSGQLAQEIQDVRENEDASLPGMQHRLARAFDDSLATGELNNHIGQVQRELIAAQVRRSLTSAVESGEFHRSLASVEVAAPKPEAEASRAADAPFTLQ